MTICRKFGQVFMILRAMALAVFFALIVSVVFFQITGKAHAEDAVSGETAPALPTLEDLLKKEQEALKKFTVQLKVLTTRYEDEQNKDRSLVEIRQELQNLGSNIIDEAIAFRAPLQDLNLRLDQLGTPASGQSETKSASTERQLLVKQKGEVNTVVGEFEKLSISTNRLIENAALKRRELFAQALTQKVSLDAALLQQVKIAGGDSSASFLVLIRSFIRWIVHFRLLAFSLAIGSGLLVGGCVFAFGLSTTKKISCNTYDEDGKISYLQRCLVAFLAAVVPAVSLASFFAFTSFLFNYNNLLWPDIKVIFSAVGGFCFIVVLMASIARAFLRPARRDFALVDVTPKAARKLVVLFTLIAAIIGLERFFDAVYQVVAAPLSLTVAKNLVVVVVVGLLLIAIAFVCPAKNEGKCRLVPFPNLMRFFIVLLGGVPLALALLGYVGLGRFIVQLIVIGGTFIFLMLLGFSTARALSAEGAFGTTIVGRMLQQRFDFSPTVIDQLGLLSGILLGGAVFALCTPPILMQLGFSWSEIVGAVVHLLTGFQIGNVSISLIGFLIGVLFFTLSWGVIRWFISWLDGTVLVRGRVDAGVRNSIRTVSGYCGVALAALIGMSAAGFNLSSLALVAGGLSLGIGFGLQNIVQNFVSGLILLAERPFKVGDFVEAGTVKGTVRRISVRATEIETNQRATIIVPNSVLINGNVGNWTLRSKLGRLDLTFTIPVKYMPQEAAEILLEVADGVEQLLKKPAPSIEFSTFDDDKYTFVIYAYVADITASIAARNALRYAVFERFYGAQIHDGETGVSPDENGNTPEQGEKQEKA